MIYRVFLNSLWIKPDDLVRVSLGPKPNKDFGMKKVFIILRISIGGWIGWWLGDHVGFMTAFFLSIVGAAAGLYIGRIVMKNYME